MRKTHSFVWAIAVVLCCAPALAQHGHRGGGIGVGGASHTSAKVRSDTGVETAARHASTAHGKTMDQILSSNTKLSDKIQSLTGESAQQACSAFKNLGQCVAAAHVSKNLDISFACLKSDMTGTAAPSGTQCPAATSGKQSTKTMSLGSAIQALRPAASSKTEAKRAQQEADQDLKDSTNQS